MFLAWSSGSGRGWAAARPVLVEVCRQRLRLVEVRGNTRQGGRGVARGVLKSVGRWSRVGCGRAGSVCRCPSCGFAGGLVEAWGCIRAVEVASRNDASKQASRNDASRNDASRNDASRNDASRNGGRLRPVRRGRAVGDNSPRGELLAAVVGGPIVARVRDLLARSRGARTLSGYLHITAILSTRLGSVR